MKYKWKWVLAFGALLLSETLVLAQGMDLFSSLGDKQKRDKNSITTIESEEMDIDIGKNQASFIGNVIIDDQEIRIECDKMTIHLLDDPEKQGGKRVSSIECQGNVRIDRKLYDEKDKQQGAQKALAGKAVYEVDSGRIVMTEKPVLKRGQDSVTGEKIIFYRNSSRLQVIGRSKVDVRPGALEQDNAPENTGTPEKPETAPIPGAAVETPAAPTPAPLVKAADLLEPKPAKPVETPPAATAPVNQP